MHAVPTSPTDADYPAQVMGPELATGSGRLGLAVLERRSNSGIDESNSGGDGRGRGTTAGAFSYSAADGGHRIGMNGTKERPASGKGDLPPEWGHRCWVKGQPHVLVAVPFKITMAEMLQQVR